MSFPQGPGNGNNPNPNNNRNNGNPFTNPFNRGNNGNNGKGNKENRPIWQSPWLWGAVLVVMVVLMFQMFAGGGTKTIDTKDGFALINQGKATYAEITDNKQVVRLELKNDYTKKNADTGKVTNYGKNVQFYYTFAQGAQVAKAVENGDLEKGWTSNIEQTSVMSYLITSILPFVIILALFWWLMSRMGGAGGMLGMGGKKNSGKLLEGQTPTTKFADVAGEDEAVAEVEEIKDFLKDPSKYKALGARIPRGVLLYGPPGTGKTLLARAIAGEAGVPFYSMAGSDFVEMFVGLGASRVRDLFDEAKKNAPAIIFIDEIDAVGRKRGSGMGGGHDEREQTLNQLLVEMDGFDNDTNLIIIAATNRPDVLDPALLRPGRFDRQVGVAAPDLEGREAILRVHAKGKPFVPDVDLHMVAVRTPGFTGADLDYTKKNADTGKVTNYGKNVQFYYTFAQGAQVAKAVENGDLEKGWTSNIEQTSMLSYLVTSILPFIIFFALFWWLMSRMGGAGGMLGMSGRKNSGKLLDGQTPTTKFADVAGEDEAVAEVEEIKDFLKDPSKYKALGARIPRGVLLYGPPGTGKTLLARAIAGEAGVPFYSMAGSDFVEMFVGLGASRVRDLFDEAKKNAPAIIFIDEIDAVAASAAPAWAVATTSASRR